MAKRGPPRVIPAIDGIEYFFHADSFSRKSRLLEDGQGPENIFFDHVNDQIEMRNDDCGHAGGVSKEVVELLEVALSVSFLLDVLRVVVEVKGRRTGLEFFQELISCVIMKQYLNSRGRCLESWVFVDWVAGGLVVGPLAVVAVGFGPLLMSDI